MNSIRKEIRVRLAFLNLTVLIFATWLIAISTPRVAHADATVNCTRPKTGVNECFVKFTATTANTKIVLPFKGCPMFENDEAVDGNAARISFLSDIASAANSIELKGGEKKGECALTTLQSSAIMPSGTAVIRFWAVGGL